MFSIRFIEPVPFLKTVDDTLREGDNYQLTYLVDKEKDKWEIADVYLEEIREEVSPHRANQLIFKLMFKIYQGKNQAFPRKVVVFPAEGKHLYHPKQKFPYEIRSSKIPLT